MMKKFTISALLGLALMPVVALAYTVQVNGDTVYNVTSVTGGTDSITYTGTPVGGGGGNTAPVIGQTSFTITEPSTAAATITATDPGDVITYSITGGTHASLFTIGASSGVLTFNSASTVGVYSVEVTAQDDDATPLTDVETITITVNASGGGGSCTSLPANVDMETGFTINFPVPFASQLLTITKNRVRTLPFTTTTNPNYYGQFTATPISGTTGVVRRMWISSVCPGDAGWDYQDVTASCRKEGTGTVVELWRQKAGSGCIMPTGTQHYLNIEPVGCPGGTCNVRLTNQTNGQP